MLCGDNQEVTHAGGLRLEPTAALLWAALGSTAASLGVREYALGRALQLDPKLVTAWTALGRLYTEAGEMALAGRCLANARSHEPTAAAVWEGMGALAASSATGADSASGPRQPGFRSYSIDWKTVKLSKYPEDEAWVCMMLTRACCGVFPFFCPNQATYAISACP